jgi:hypothetical protein
LWSFYQDTKLYNFICARLMDFGDLHIYKKIIIINIWYLVLHFCTNSRARRMKEKTKHHVCVLEIIEFRYVSMMMTMLWFCIHFYINVPRSTFDQHMLSFNFLQPDSPHNFYFKLSTVMIHLKYIAN